MKLNKKIINIKIRMVVSILTLKSFKNDLVPPPRSWSVSWIDSILSSSGFTLIDQLGGVGGVDLVIKHAMSAGTSATTVEINRSKHISETNEFELLTISGEITAPIKMPNVFDPRATVFASDR